MNIPETVLQAVDLMTEGQFEKSERLLKKVFSRDPENFDAIHASALVDIGKAQPRRGLKKLRKLTQRAAPAQMGQLTNSMGLAYKGLGEFDSALRCFEEVYDARPDSIEAGLNLAFCLQNLGRHEEEAEVCSALKSRFPGDHRVQFLAVRCRYDLGEVRAALDDFMSLGDSVDLSVYQYEQICHLLERHYRYDDLRTMATAGLRHYPESVTLTINLSRCHLEDGEFEEAVSLLEARANESKMDSVLANLYQEMGVILDKAGETQRAYEAFRHSCGYQRNNYKKARVRKSRSVGAHLKLLQRPEYVESWQQESPRSAGSDLCFLVGFPRSGTTLLERVLDSHSAIHALPELNFTQQMIEHLGGTERYPYKLNTLKESELAELQQLYRTALASESRPQSTSLTLDKLPLNLIHAPLIHKVFPRAKFILALRHPADCTLSCFMQNFQKNEEMAHFLSLQEATDRYAEVFGLWNLYRQNLPLDVYEIRYEDLVADFEPEVRKLTSFLGLEYEAAQANYHQDAMKKGAVQTPSYRQVSKPIYRSSSYRWKRYSFAMEEYLPTLEPFIEQFGYAE